jgi:lipopolysaccharide transport system ATP-binding protein
MQPAVVFDGVWKKFHRGERQDSLRDLVPAALKRLVGPRDPAALTSQEFWALQNVSFEVRPGEALGIIGANGAGKSTTLKLLTKILRPTRGVSEVRGRTGALIEIAAGFHPDLTGRENIYLQGAIMGMRGTDIVRRFDEIVEFAGVRDFIDTPVKRYSSGMSARLGFAIAAHLEPDVLLVDEVLSVGDMAFQRRCVERMQIIRRAGTAIVFVSHDLSAVGVMCTRAILMGKGSVVMDGSAASVIQTYVERSGQTQAESTATYGPDGTSIGVRGVHLPAQKQVLALAPGDRLGVTLSLQTPRPVNRLVLVTHVVQQGTRALVYDGNTSLHTLARQMAHPVPAVAEHRGQIDLNVDLRLNLLRGVYDLGFSIYDPATQEHLAWLKPAVIFGIQELNSYSGIADLDVRVAPVVERILQCR